MIYNSVRQSYGLIFYTAKFIFIPGNNILVGTAGKRQISVIGSYFVSI